MNHEVECSTTNHPNLPAVNWLEEDNCYTYRINSRPMSSANAEGHISEISVRFLKLLCGDVDLTVEKQTTGSALSDVYDPQTNDDSLQVELKQVSPNSPEELAQSRMKSILDEKEEIEKIICKIIEDSVFQYKDWTSLKKILEQTIFKWKHDSFKDFKPHIENGLELACIVRENMAADLLHQVDVAGRQGRRTRSGFTNFGKNEVVDYSDAKISPTNKEQEVKDKLSGIGKVFRQYQAVLAKSKQTNSNIVLPNTEQVSHGLTFSKKTSFKDLFESKLSELENDIEHSSAEISSPKDDLMIPIEPSLTTLFSKGNEGIRHSPSSISFSSEDSTDSSHTTVISVCSELCDPSSQTSLLPDEELLSSSPVIDADFDVNTLDETRKTSLSAISFSRSTSQTSVVDDKTACQLFCGTKSVNVPGTRQSFYECEMEIAYYQEKLAKIKKEKLERERQQVVVNIYLQQLEDIERECLKELEKIQQSKQDLLPLEKIVQQWQMSEEDKLEFLSMPPPVNNSFDYIMLNDEYKSILAPMSVLKPHSVKTTTLDEHETEEAIVIHVDNADVSDL